MCGFNGFYLNNICEKQDLLNQVNLMSATIEHRGPDDSGAWVEEDIGLALGHRRLSIVDISEAGHQPMHSHSSRFIIAFNGEIYNHKELRAQLELLSRDSIWRGTSDTETLLAAFEHWGVEDTLDKLVGMFAISLWDKIEKKLYLIRDRFGEKPLYFGWINTPDDSVFAFGSELKCFRAYKGFSNKVSRVALKEYFRFMYVPAPYSIYENIFKLEAGCILILDGAPPKASPDAPPHPLEGIDFKYLNIIVKRWYSVKERISSQAGKSFKSECVAYDALERQLQETIQIQSEADVPLGAFLSGGVDSSLIVALMQENQSKPVETFTIGFEDKRFDEAIYAKKVAKHLKTNHHELFVSASDAQSLIPKLPNMYDEPFADSSQIPTHFVSMSAKQEVTVSLSGDAGDELFGGYNRYLWAPALWNKIKWMPFLGRKAIGNSLSMLPIDSWDQLEKIYNYFNQGGKSIVHLGDKIHKTARRLKTVYSIDDLYKNLVSEWPNPEQLVIDSSATSSDYIVKILDEALPLKGMKNPESRMMYWDVMTYMTDDILCKVDRAAMGVSLETRVPFLDHRVAELAWQIPLQMKIHNGQGKWPLREILYKRVPKSLIERPKAGFGIPIGDWLRGPMREWVESLISTDRLSKEGYLEPMIVRQVWMEHLEGKRNWSFRLWSILMFQSWLEKNSN
jgi:asparagine synthase (glutamine-hydrolysing)